MSSSSALIEAFRQNVQNLPHGGNALTTPSAPVNMNFGGDVGQAATYSQPTESVFAPSHKFTYDKSLSDPYALVNTSTLGWRPDIVNQLSGYGITEIPAWMQYLGKGGRERSDLASGIQRALAIDPVAWLNTAGKRQKAMHQAGISGADDGRLYGGMGKQTVEWTPETKAAVQQAYLNRLTKPNHGGFNPLGQEMAGLGIVLAPIALATGAWAGAPAAGGAAAAGEGAAAGGGLGGLELGADLGMGASGLGISGGGAGAGGLGGLELGADVGMGGGTNLFTSLGAPASYDTLGQAGYLGSGLLGGTSGGGGMFDSIGGLLNSGWGNVIQGGLGALGSWLGGQEQAEAADKSADVLWKMYNTNRADMAPLLSLLGTYAPQFADVASKGGFDYTSDPIYQADKAEMIRALNRGQASKGLLRSSDTDNAMTRNLSTLMNNAYARKYGGLLDLLKLGSGAASSAGTYGANTGNALAGVYSNAGNNQANMYGGMFASGMGALNNYQLYNLLAGMKGK